MKVLINILCLVFLCRIWVFEHKDYEKVSNEVLDFICDAEKIVSITQTSSENARSSNNEILTVLTVVIEK